MSFLTSDYFYLSFADLVSIGVTIISVVLIVKQLNDSRLAVQMEGFLTISDRFSVIAPAIEFVDGLGISEEWKTLDGAGAYHFLIENQENKQHYMQVAVFYEGVAALLRRGALDQKLALDTVGRIGAKRWKTMEKAILYHREVMGENALYDQWEWLAENINSR